MSKKMLIMLVAIVTGAFMAPVAMAINYGDLAYQFPGDLNTAGTILNPEGKGDVLICPYYDVRPINNTAQDNYFAIINENMSAATNGGVAAKLRFREWDKSEEVFDIDIWLSDNDVWVGVLTRNTATGLTHIWSPDYIIIAPFTGAGATFTISKVSALWTTGIDFISTNVPGGSGNTKAPPTGFSAAWTAADMTNLGYFEIIGEERTASRPVIGTATTVTRLTPGTLEFDCPNSLSAYVFVVRVADGTSMAYDCTAIANFRRDGGALFAGAGSGTPTLFQCEDTLAQLEFELSKSRVYQGYSIETGVNAAFSLIITFPTKWLHFGVKPVYTASGQLAPYTLPFNGGPVGAASHHANDGEDVNVTIFDREEHTAATGFISPRTTASFTLPYEVNIAGLFFAAPATLPRSGRNNIGWSTGTFDTGWLWVDLYNSVHYLAIDNWFGHLGLTFDAFYGLPAIALAVQEFQNLTLTPGGYYGDILPAFYEVNWLLDTET
jgi:hypothetical protein